MSAKIFNSPAMMSVFEQIAAERVRQQELLRAGKFTYTAASPVADNNRKLRILVEEVGEVAEAIDHLEQLNHNSPAAKRQREHLREELIQVAAVAVAWLEALEGK
jgi:NTP pyrophosphatase (non-canonical NTP hydrolase)